MKENGKCEYIIYSTYLGEERSLGHSQIKKTKVVYRPLVRGFSNIGNISCSFFSTYTSLLTTTISAFLPSKVQLSTPSLQLEKSLPPL